MSTIFTFRDQNSDAYGIFGTPTLGLLPERRVNRGEITGRDGAYDFGSDSYAVRPLRMECLLKATPATLTDALDAAALWLAGEGWLIMGRSPTRRMWAKVAGQVDLTRTQRSGRFAVDFDINPPWPEDVNARAGAVGTAQDYGSPRPFAPVITATITTVATWLQVTHLASGRYVRIEDTLAVGNVIAIDMNTGKVTKNGTSIMTKVRIESLFFTVPPGSQTITLTTDGAATATMSYRRRYLYA